MVVGILAHVDAGKTTLAECMLHLSGKLRETGRVDHGDAFLDHFALERKRGITIFSKQARFAWNGVEITLLDTPGHVDFAAEMERTLSVLDCAILVINGTDGVQGHTRTVWKLLDYYDVPVFVFVNKMDQPGNDRDALMEQLRRQLDGNCVCFSTQKRGEGVREREAAWLEEIATCDESLMNRYLESGELTAGQIAQAIWDRRIFPCYFGAALKEEGVAALLDGIVEYDKAFRAEYPGEQEYPAEFGARVYQITRDGAGMRLTHIKVTGGSLRVKAFLENGASAQSDAERFSEKADQLRLYNGTEYVLAEEVKAGEICAVTGLTKTFVGQGLGFETENEKPVLEPVLTYRIELPEGEDAVRVLGLLRQLEEEEPLLHILWQEETKEIHAQVMGEVQIEILQELITERFGLSVTFGEGSIVYKETLAKPAIGVGHFEPLRHYAEVELLLEPGEPGSGMQFASVCSEDVLDRNWQRLILTHLEERSHVGVLTGAAVTDLRILLVAGRAHAKHTEGGDFRQATYRAVRQGLRSGESILLEPMFSFVMELPTEHLGRAMSDVQRMYGSFETPETEGDRSVLRGRAPVSTMRDYQREVAAYTHGTGHLACTPDGYAPCHNAEEVIAQKGYDPEADVANPTGSVFCAHGAGYLVDWDQVPAYAHVEIPADIRAIVEQGQQGGSHAGEWAGSPSEDSCLDAADKNTGRVGGAAARGGAERYITQEEIEQIFAQTYGKNEKDERHRRRYHVTRRDSRMNPAGGQTGEAGAAKKSCLLVDGYNIIFAWDELRALSEVNIDSARDRLMDILSNYQGTLGGELILVFDAYKVKGNPGSAMKYHNIYVVFTKEAETADQYIEKTVHEMADQYQITVATSDRLEQMIIWGDGAMRMSARGLYEAVEREADRLRENYMAT
ncbi:MAG: TetM/TetW/TetO/TetS family tetracycline resistance ribosomal protection protein [Lachnospiraceae bacterium]|nr:TetM/TetW/TetO/TetS family tetracycline resistance ribosomal protection protein [Lachnospiraceae bacterium]